MIDAGHVFTGRFGREKKPHNPERCCAAVSSGGWAGICQCSRKPVVFRDVLHHGKAAHYGYCKQHDPVTVEARAAAQQAKWVEQERIRRAELDRAARAKALREEALDALKAIAAGHNDPRGLALEVLAKNGEPKEKT